MGKILNNEKYVEVHISLEDIFKADGNAVKFALASLAVHFIRAATPELARHINSSYTITQWEFVDGEVVVYVGKEGHDEFEIIHGELA